MAAPEDGTKTPKDKLLIALRKGQGERVVSMLEHFSGELNPNMSADTADNRLLHRAARFGHPGVIRALVQKGGDVHMTNKFGMTPLHHAAVHGASDVLLALLEAGADPNKPDAQGRLPLHWTAAKGHVAGSRVLIEAGARALGPDHEGFTPLHRCGQEDPMDKPDPALSPEEAAEARAKLDRSKAQVTELLVAKEADVNVRESKGHQTPLHLAAMNGFECVANALIHAKADVDAKNKIGQTPLIYAVIEQQAPVIELLIKSRADVNYGNKLHSNWAAIHWAALTDDVKVVEAVLKSDKVKNVKDASGRFPASLAAEHGKFRVLGILEKLKKQ